MISLRDYQESAIANTIEAYRAGKNAVLVVSPTGSGKTVTGSEIVRRHVEKGGTVNWYAHRRELITQAAATLERSGLVVGHSGLRVGAPVQVVSAQAALSRGEVRPSTLDVFDEAHHYAADDWGRLMSSHARRILGLSATPQRGDGRALSGFDHIVVAAQVSELIRRGHLVPVEVIGPRRTLPKNKITMKPVDAHARYANGRRNVIFAPHVKAANDYAADFRARGFRCSVVHGNMSATDRDDALARFASGETRILINVYVLTEGWDCPATEVITIARSVGSEGMYLQICGRGLRPAPGKRLCTILDLRGVRWLHGLPDEDREFTIDGVGISRKGATGPRVCSLCKRPLDDGEVVCSVCGREVAELETPEATGDPMVKYAAIRRDAEDARAARLGKWIRELRGRGIPVRNAIGSASHKFKAVYGERPSSAIVAAALRGGER